MGCGDDVRPDLRVEGARLDRFMVVVMVMVTGPLGVKDGLDGAVPQVRSICVILLGPVVVGKEPAY